MAAQLEKLFNFDQPLDLHLLERVTEAMYQGNDADVRPALCPS